MPRCQKSGLCHLVVGKSSGPQSLVHSAISNEMVGPSLSKATKRPTLPGTNGSAGSGNSRELSHCMLEVPLNYMYIGYVYVYVYSIYIYVCVLIHVDTLLQKNSP